MKSQFQIIVSTENDHLDVRIAVMYRHRKIDTVHQRHYNVTDNNLWLKLFDLIHGIFTICSFPHSKHSPKNGLILYRAFAGSTLTDFPLIFTFFMAFNTSFPYSCGTSTNV